MRFRSTKAAGSFECSRPGSFELLVTMEADPNALSYAIFSFDDALPPARAADFSCLPAYLLRHRAGTFVICIESKSLRRSHRYHSAWEELDAVLARRGIWLFATSRDELRREPNWSNALRIAGCAQSFDLADQERVVAHLTDVGRDSVRSCMKLCASSSDSFDALLGLVAAGVLFLDPPDDLSPGATVRLTPPNSTSIDWLSQHVEASQRISGSATRYQQPHDSGSATRLRTGRLRRRLPPRQR
jgi:hypothetical protein